MASKLKKKGGVVAAAGGGGGGGGGGGKKRAAKLISVYPSSSSEEEDDPVEEVGEGKKKSISGEDLIAAKKLIDTFRNMDKQDSQNPDPIEAAQLSKMSSMLDAKPSHVSENAYLSQVALDLVRSGTKLIDSYINQEEEEEDVVEPPAKKTKEEQTGFFKSPIKFPMSLSKVRQNPETKKKSASYRSKTLEITPLSQPVAAGDGCVVFGALKSWGEYHNQSIVIRRTYQKGGEERSYDFSFQHTSYREMIAAIKMIADELSRREKDFTKQCH